MVGACNLLVAGSAVELASTRNMRKSGKKPCVQSSPSLLRSSSPHRHLFSPPISRRRRGRSSCQRSRSRSLAGSNVKHFAKGGGHHLIPKVSWTIVSASVLGDRAAEAATRARFTKSESIRARTDWSAPQLFFFFKQYTSFAIVFTKIVCVAGLWAILLTMRSLNW